MSIVLPRDARLRMLSKNFGPTASTKRVKVYYHKMRNGHAERSTWTTMGHADYFKWLETAPANGLVLESVEQIND